MALANTPSRLITGGAAGVALTGTEQTIYTAPSGSGLTATAVITTCTLCNTTGADRQVYAGVGSTATAANMRLSGIVVPANDTLVLGVYWPLLNVETFRAYCSLSGGVTIELAGVL